MSEKLDLSYVPKPSFHAQELKKEGFYCYFYNIKKQYSSFLILKKDGKLYSGNHAFLNERADVSLRRPSEKIHGFDSFFKDLPDGFYWFHNESWELCEIVYCKVKTLYYDGLKHDVIEGSFVGVRGTLSQKLISAKKDTEMNFFSLYTGVHTGSHHFAQIPYRYKTIKNVVPTLYVDPRSSEQKKLWVFEGEFDHLEI